MDYDVNKEQEMRDCHHLFVVLKKDDSSNKPLVVQCIFCGLTNKYLKEDEKKLDNYKRMINKVFWDSYYTHQDNNTFNSNELNYISEEVFVSKHLNYLYNLAKEINKDATPEELFAIMKKLREYETIDERRKDDFQPEEKIAMKKRYNRLKR